MKRCHRPMASGSIIFLVCLFFFFHFMRNSGLRTVKKKEKKTAMGTNLVFVLLKRRPSWGRRTRETCHAGATRQRRCRGSSSLGARRHAGPRGDQDHSRGGGRSAGRRSPRRSRRRSRRRGAVARSDLLEGPRLSTVSLSKADGA